MLSFFAPFFGGVGIGRNALRFFPQSEPYERCEGEESECEGARLRAGEESEVFLRVVPAEIFEEEAHAAIQHDVEGETLSARVSVGAEREEAKITMSSCPSHTSAGQSACAP